MAQSIVTINRFLTLNPAARPCGRGYRGPCPACGGKNHSNKFSFTEREGKILVNCFSGCSANTICEALGIELKYLFVDAGLTTEQRRALPPRPKYFDWRGFSSDLEFASEHHWLRAKNIFTAAQQCEPPTMNESDLTESWKCLPVGFYALLISENLGIAAFKIRQTGLKDEARRYRARRVEA